MMGLCRRLGATACHLGALPAGEAVEADEPQVPVRHVPSLGLSLPVVGFGAFGLTAERTQAECNEALAAAVRMGATYIDVAPAYGAGEAERKLGPALAGVGRERCFVSCKTGKRSAEEAATELENSLEVVGTSYFDLYQCHAVTTAEDVDRILAPGGALEAMKAAKAAGKIRAIGFSAHDEKQACRLIATGEFATVMFPFNFYSVTVGEVGMRVLAAAKKKGMGVFALKSMARCRLEPHGTASSKPLAAANTAARGLSHPQYKVWYQPEDDLEYAALLLRFTLSVGGGIVASALSPGHLDLFDSLASLARGKTLAEISSPLTAEEEGRLLERGEGLVPVFHEGNRGPGNMQNSENWEA